MMIKTIKGFLKRQLLARGYHVVWANPTRRVTGISLELDLQGAVQESSPVCFDIGANIGQTIRMLQHVFKVPRIYAFEPSSACFTQLENENFGMNTLLHNLALGEVMCERQFNHYATSTLDSFHQLSASEENPFREWGIETQSTVSIITFDDFVQQHNVSRIDLLKTDTQGFDLQVLRGASGSFQSGIVQNVLVELNFLELYQDQDSAAEILTFLKTHGFGLVDMYEKVYCGRVMGWCTALFSRIADD